MQRVRTVLPLLVLAFVLCVTQAQAQVTGIGEVERPWENVFMPRSMDSFSSPITGTWFGQFRIEIPVDPPLVFEIPFIQTYNIDGTAQTSTTNPATSLHHMSWKRTGPREIKWRIMHFNNDANNDLTFITRTYGVQQYDPGFGSFTGEFTVERCDCAAIPDTMPTMYDCSAVVEALLADPNDPDVCFNPPIPAGTMQAKRLRIDVP